MYTPHAPSPIGLKTVFNGCHATPSRAPVELHWVLGRITGLVSMAAMKNSSVLLKGANEIVDGSQCVYDVPKMLHTYSLLVYHKRLVPSH